MTMAGSCWQDSDQRCCWCLVEADSAHRAHSVVLAAPVREVVVVALLQDVMRSSVVWLLIHHPPTHTGRRDRSVFC